MEEKELLHTISLLKTKIKPKEDWAFLLKKQILREEQANTLVGIGQRTEGGFFVRVVSMARTFRMLQNPVLVTPVILLLMVGGVGYAASKSLPGDTLYSVRSFVERSRLSVVPEDQKTILHVELAQKRLEDLKKITEENKVKNLHATIQQLEGNIAKASKEFTVLVEKEPKKALQASKGIVELQKEKNKVEKVLGTTLGGKEAEELEIATKTLVEREVADLETRSLTPEQEAILSEIKKDVEQKEYQNALEQLWKISGTAE